MILFGVNVIAIWGLDLQFGVAGIYNFAFIVFQAAGAYTAGLLALHPAAYYGSFETYIGGANLPFPLPLFGAAVVGGLLAVPVGLVAIRRLRGDYQAMAMLVLSLIATGVANAQLGLVNGPTGIEEVPKPLQNVLNVSPATYQWLFVAFTGVCCVIAWLVVRALTRSPFGRLLRAVRESESAVAALGRNPNTARMVALVVGGALAGLSGGILVEYINAWGPASWLYPETFLYLTAIIVGGTGNLAGCFIGAAVVPIGFVEGTRFLPQIGYPGLIDSLDWIVIGLLMLGFLWFRPRGLLPERRWVVESLETEHRGPLARLSRRRLGEWGQTVEIKEIR